MGPRLQVPGEDAWQQVAAVVSWTWPGKFLSVFSTPLCHEQGVRVPQRICQSDLKHAHGPHLQVLGEDARQQVGDLVGRLAPVVAVKDAEQRGLAGYARQAALAEHDVLARLHLRTTQQLVGMGPMSCAA